MADPCSGGPSGLKPGVAAANVVGAGLITLGIEALAPYLLPFTLLIDAYVAESSVLCASPPPDPPTFTDQDLKNLVGGVFNPGFPTTLSKIKQLLDSYLWGQWCQCTGSGTTYTPVPPPPPASIGTQDVTPAGACATVSADVTLPLKVGNGNPSQQLQVPQLTPEGTAARKVITDPDGTISARSIPTGFTSMSWTSQLQDCPNCVGPQCTYLRINFYSTTGTLLRTLDLTGSLSNFPIPSGTTHYYAWGYSDTGPCNSSQLHATSKIDYYCGGAGPGVYQNCCPPDSSVATGVSELIQMVQQLANQLVVGNASLVPANTHVGLHGSGSVILTNACAAIRVDVTSPLTNWPKNPGDPDYFFSLGFITSFAMTSPLKGWRLVYNAQTFPLAAYADQIGYTLPPGVTVNIVELLAGP